MDVKVDKVDEQGVIAGGKRISSATVLWTAGVAASPIPKMLGPKIDRAGRALVDPFLKVVDAPGIFVVGDAASLMQDGHPVPGASNQVFYLGMTPTRQGEVLAKTVAENAKTQRIVIVQDERRPEAIPFAEVFQKTLADARKEAEPATVMTLRYGKEPNWSEILDRMVMAPPQARCSANGWASQSSFTASAGISIVAPNFSACVYARPASACPEMPVGKPR